MDSSVDYRAIGTRIKMLRLRLRHAIAQTECAERLGISQTHLSNIEHGRAGITLQILCRLCDILQTGLDYLVRGEEKSTAANKPDITIEEVVQVIKMLKGLEEK